MVFPCFLYQGNIVEGDYYNALSVSTDGDFQVHFKRQSNSCFVNNYFAEGLLAWQANIDIQPVINHYKAVAYMCAYRGGFNVRQPRQVA